MKSLTDLFKEPRLQSCCVQTGSVSFHPTCTVTTSTGTRNLQQERQKGANAGTPHMKLLHESPPAMLRAHCLVQTMSHSIWPCWGKGRCPPPPPAGSDWPLSNHSLCLHNHLLVWLSTHYNHLLDAFLLFKYDGGFTTSPAATVSLHSLGLSVWPSHCRPLTHSTLHWPVPQVQSVSTWGHMGGLMFVRQLVL